MNESKNEIENKNDDENMCCICYEPLNNMLNLGELECHHCYCFDCIMEWSKKETACPQCRQKFDKIKKNTYEKMNNYKSPIFDTNKTYMTRKRKKYYDEQCQQIKHQNQHEQMKKVKCEEIKVKPVTQHETNRSEIDLNVMNFFEFIRFPRMNEEFDLGTSTTTTTMTTIMTNSRNMDSENSSLRDAQLQQSLQPQQPQQLQQPQQPQQLQQLQQPQQLQQLQQQLYSIRPTVGMIRPRAIMRRTNFVRIINDFMTMRMSYIINNSVRDMVDRSDVNNDNI